MVALPFLSSMMASALWQLSFTGAAGGLARVTLKEKAPGGGAPLRKLAPARM